MKNFITLLLILIGINLYGQEVKPWTKIYDIHPEDVRDYVWNATHELDMYGYYIQVRELKGVGNISAEASIKHVEGKKFILYLKKGLGNNLKELIYHELFHMKQIERGDLEIVENGYMWKGTFYPTPKTRREHKNLPFEKEVFNKVKHVHN